MAVSFMTFASSNWTNSPARFKRDLQEIRTRFSFFNRDFVLSEKDCGADYQERFSPYYADHGYAYWSWKPYAIRQSLASLDEGEWLLYLDGDCVLPMDRIDAFLRDLRTAIAKTEAAGSLFSLTTFHQPVPCAYIVKQSILRRFGLEDDLEFLFRFPHWQSGLILCRNTPDTLAFLGRWYQFYLDNYETAIRGGFTDRTGEVYGFIHNGGDQAILQCMLRTEKTPVDDSLNFMHGYGGGMMFGCPG